MKQHCRGHIEPSNLLEALVLWMRPSGYDVEIHYEIDVDEPRPGSKQLLIYITKVYIINGRHAYEQLSERWYDAFEDELKEFCREEEDRIAYEKYRGL